MLVVNIQKYWLICLSSPNQITGMVSLFAARMVAVNVLAASRFTLPTATTKPL